MFNIYKHSMFNIVSLKIPPQNKRKYKYKQRVYNMIKIFLYKIMSFKPLRRYLSGKKCVSNKKNEKENYNKRIYTSGIKRVSL